MLTQLLQLQSDLDALERQLGERLGLDYKQVVRRRRRRRRRLGKRAERTRRRARVGTRRRLLKKKGKDPGRARRRVRKRLAKSPVRKGGSKYEELRSDFSLGSELIDLWDELIEAGTELVGTARDAARFAVPPVVDEVLRTIVREVRAGVISKAQAIRTALARGDVRRALGEVASVAVPNLDRFQTRGRDSLPRQLVYDAGVVRDAATGAVVRRYGLLATNDEDRVQDAMGRLSLLLPATAEEIADEARISVADAIRALVALEQRGLVRQAAGFWDNVRKSF